MPIRPFLAGQAFEPETTCEMSLALQQVCDALSLKLVDDAATTLIAGKIVELALRGVRDVSTLTSMTLKEFQHTDRRLPGNRTVVSVSLWQFFTLTCFCPGSGNAMSGL